jgi:hypothetical protein
MSLFGPDSTTLLAEDTSPDFGDSAFIQFTASDSGWLYLRLSHPKGTVAGDAVSYKIWILEGYEITLPMIAH